MGKGNTLRETSDRTRAAISALTGPLGVSLIELSYVAVSKVKRGERIR